MPFVSWRGREAGSLHCEATMTSALIKVSNNDHHWTSLQLIVNSSKIFCKNTDNVRQSSTVSYKTRSESSLLMLGGPIKHTKGMNFNQVFA